MIEVNKLTSLGGQRCVIVADEYSSTEPVVSGLDVDYSVVPMSGEYEGHFWANEKQVKEARKTGNGKPVYGLFQVLLFNDALDTRLPLQIIKLSDRHGIFVHCVEGKVAQTGHYAGDQITALGTVRVRDVPVAKIKEKRLKLPKSEILLAQEIAERHFASQRIRIIRSALISVVFALSAFGVDQWLDGIEESRLAQVSVLETERSRLMVELAAMRAIKFTASSERDRQSKVILHLLELTALDPLLSVNETSFQSRNWRAEASTRNAITDWIDSSLPTPINTFILDWTEQ